MSHHIAHCSIHHSCIISIWILPGLYLTNVIGVSVLSHSCLTNVWLILTDVPLMSDWYIIWLVCKSHLTTVSAVSDCYLTGDWQTLYWLTGILSISDQCLTWCLTKILNSNWDLTSVYVYLCMFQSFILMLQGCVLMCRWCVLMCKSCVLTCK